MPELPDPQSSRLIFHRHGVGDFAESAALWGDPAVTLYIGGVPSTPAESWSRLLRYAGHWALTGYGFWVVRDQETGRFVGEVGLKQFRRDLDPAWEALPEAGWVMRPDAQGGGLATEAVRAALAWGDDHFGWARVVCMIDPGNAASLRVAAKCGFVACARTQYRQKEVVILERERKELLF
jgi:RimJ/RimL family protein N-acetyltransferase